MSLTKLSLLLLEQIALGGILDASIDTKFGRNSDVDIGVVEDLWEGGGIYPGQPTSNVEEAVECYSSSAADTAAGTGARTISITGLKSPTSTAYETETVTLNGTTPVDSASTWYRVNRVKVLTAGSGATNAGTITVRHTTTTANVFAGIPVGYGQSAIGAYTVPAGKVMLIKRMRVGLVRANGSAGSATVTFRCRPSGGIFNAARVFEVSTNSSIDFSYAGGHKIPEGCDLKFTIDAVSDANSIFDGAFEYLLITDD